MRTILWLALCALAMAGSVTGGRAQEADNGPPGSPCGTQPIAIARMSWPSAALLAEIHARVLKAQFGCTVRVVPGDMAATGSSMATTGQPAIAPEMWIARIADIWNPGVKGQTLRPAGQSYGDNVLEGWFVPDYLADANPGLVSAASLKIMSALFADGQQKPRFISCPPDWGCSVINRNMLRANGLDGLFDIVEPGNRFEMDSMIADAVSRRAPVLFYYWQPNAVLAQFGFKRLDLGPFDKDAFTCLGEIACANPKPSSFSAEPVVTAVAEWVFTDIPVIAAYFQRASMPMPQMDEMLFALNTPGISVETEADRFIAEHADIWRGWLGNAP